METVSEAMGEICDLLKRMSKVRPELTRLSEAAGSVAKVLEDSGLGEIDIDKLDGEAGDRVPASLHEIYESETLSKALVEAIELAVAVDRSDHHLGRILEIVKNSVFRKVGRTGAA